MNPGAAADRRVRMEERYPGPDATSAQRTALERAKEVARVANYRPPITSTSRNGSGKRTRRRRGGVLYVRGHEGDPRYIMPPFRRPYVAPPGNTTSAQPTTQRSRTSTSRAGKRTRRSKSKIRLV